MAGYTTEEFLQNDFLGQYVVAFLKDVSNSNCLDSGDYPELFKRWVEKEPEYNRLAQKQGLGWQDFSRFEPGILGAVLYYCGIDFLEDIKYFNVQIIRCIVPPRYAVTRLSNTDLITNYLAYALQSSLTIDIDKCSFGKFEHSYEYSSLPLVLGSLDIKASSGEIDTTLTNSSEPVFSKIKIIDRLALEPGAISRDSSFCRIAYRAKPNYLSIPRSIKKIYWGAFAKFTDLTKVYLPKDVEVSSNYKEDLMKIAEAY